MERFCACIYQINLKQDHFMSKADIYKASSPPRQKRALSSSKTTETTKEILMLQDSHPTASSFCTSLHLPLVVFGSP